MSNIADKVVVLYGGSFNPVHIGHVMAVAQIISGIEPDEVKVVPSHTHPFGKKLEGYQHRINMLRRAMKMFGDRVVVSNIEAKAKPTCTLDLVKYLQKRHPKTEYIVIIGADCWIETPKWEGFEELQDIAPVAVLGREGIEVPVETSFPIPKISSTEIRDKLAENLGQPVDGLPYKVWEYIRGNKLYGTDWEIAWKKQQAAALEEKAGE